MATERQIEANRVNARRSTGPRTAAGKTRSRGNAVKHGLLARQVMVSQGDGRAFGRFRARSLRQLRPVGPLEEFLADRVITQSWRLRRVLAIESRIADWDAAAEQKPARDPGDVLIERRLLAILESDEPDEPHEHAPVDQAPNEGEPHHRAMDEGAADERPAYEEVGRAACPAKSRLLSGRSGVPAGLPAGASGIARPTRLREDSDDGGEAASGAAIRQTLAGPNSAFDVLRRYERGIDRGLYAAMRELERMQDKRRDQGPGNRDQGLGTRDQGLGNRDQGLGNRDQGLGTRDQGLGGKLKAESGRLKAEVGPARRSGARPAARKQQREARPSTGSARVGGRGDQGAARQPEPATSPGGGKETGASAFSPLRQGSAGQAASRRPTRPGAEVKICETKPILAGSRRGARPCGMASCAVPKARGAASEEAPLRPSKGPKRRAKRRQTRAKRRFRPPG